jgi:hypothetical protein
MKSFTIEHVLIIFNPSSLIYYKNMYFHRFYCTCSIFMGRDIFWPFSKARGRGGGRGRGWSNWDLW